VASTGRDQNNKPSSVSTLIIGASMQRSLQLCDMLLSPGPVAPELALRSARRPRYLQVRRTTPKISDTAIRPYLGMAVGMRALQGYRYSQRVFRQCIFAMDATPRRRDIRCMNHESQILCTHQPQLWPRRQWSHVWARDHYSLPHQSKRFESRIIQLTVNRRATVDAATWAAERLPTTTCISCTMDSWIWWQDGSWDLSAGVEPALPVAS
jgi:hypothetical protein